MVGSGVAFAAGLDAAFGAVLAAGSLLPVGGDALAGSMRSALSDGGAPSSGPGTRDLCNSRDLSMGGFAGAVCAAANVSIKSPAMKASDGRQMARCMESRIRSLKLEFGNITAQK